MGEQARASKAARSAAYHVPTELVLHSLVLCYEPREVEGRRGRAKGVEGGRWPSYLGGEQREVRRPAHEHAHVEVRALRGVLGACLPVLGLVADDGEGRW